MTSTSGREIQGGYKGVWGGWGDVSGSGMGDSRKDWGCYKANME